MTNTIPDVEQQARAAWRRITNAVESGAPVPNDINIRGGVSISYSHTNCADPIADAAAMARVLGLTEGPISGTNTVRWKSSLAEWQATGESWSVWAHLPEPDPDGVDLAAIGTRHPQGGAA